MKSVPTKDLTGRALAYAVAVADPSCRGLQFEVRDGTVIGFAYHADEAPTAVICFPPALTGPRGLFRLETRYPDLIWYRPESDWRMAGVIFDQYPWCLPRQNDDSDTARIGKYVARTQGGVVVYGNTALEAAMRAFAMQSHGDTVELFEELIT